jgi:hypothetical protein
MFIVTGFFHARIQLRQERHRALAHRVAANLVPVVMNMPLLVELG